MAEDVPNLPEFKSATIKFPKNYPEQRRFPKRMRKPIKLKKYNTETIVKKIQLISNEGSSMIDVHAIDKSDSLGSKEYIQNNLNCIKIANPYFKKIPEKNPDTSNYNSIIKPTILQSLKKMAALTLSVLIVSIIFKNFIILCDSHCYDYDVTNITDALDHLLYGQKDVISDLKSNLNYVDNQQIYIFTGGSGVGKTYAANIISNKFPWQNNIQKIVSHDNTSIETVINGLARFDYNLLIVDSLEMSDEAFAIDFVKALMVVPKKMIIFLIFNIQEISLELKKEVDLLSASNAISDAFDDAKIDHDLFVFNKLTEEDVKNCVKDELQKVNLKNDYNVGQILQSVDYEYSGCKRVYSKVALLK